MLTELHILNFKSWQDTKKIKFGSLTGLFGNNSTGKTAIIQFLLMLKQTVESADRQQVLYTGDEKTYVDIGTLYDVIYRHITPSTIQFLLAWNLAKPLDIINPEGEVEDILFSIPALSFKSAIEVGDEASKTIAVKSLFYSFHSQDLDYSFGMQREDSETSEIKSEYKLIDNPEYSFKPVKDVLPLPNPVKSYSFPAQMNAYYKNAGFLSDLVLAFEELFQNIYYLGPLRDYPRRSYTWAGHQPQDVGQKGELAIPALLASRTFEKITRGQDQRQQSIEECVAQWLRELGIIQDFKLQPIARNRQEYEVLVRRTPNAAEVLITDVGFGVSQILPVLVLCYYVPKGSTIIFEQPEIHLHPSVQAGLADVFIDAIKTRNIQIILESHSEHLLHRLQRRIAEEKLSPSDTALYFCQIDDRGNSHLLPLDIDSFGNINNHSQIFLGNDMSDLQAMAEAAKQRQEKAEAMEATATDPSPEKVNME